MTPAFTLWQGEAQFIEHARCVKRHGAAVVIMAFDEEGQAADEANKARPRHICTGNGAHPCHICTGTWAHPCYICTGTWAHPRHTCTGLGASLCLRSTSSVLCRQCFVHAMARLPCCAHCRTAPRRLRFGLFGAAGGDELRCAAGADLPARVQAARRDGPPARPPPDWPTGAIVSRSMQAAAGIRERSPSLRVQDGSIDALECFR